MMRFISFLPALVFLLWARIPAESDGNPPDSRCTSFYQSGEYEKAADCYNAQLYTGAVSDTQGLVSLYEHLGVCLTMLDKKAPARGAFIKLLDLDPGYELDPNVYLPEVISLFQIVKFEQKTSFRVLIVDTLPAYPGAYNFIPLGMPQFLNLESRKGVAVAGLQALLLAASVYAYGKKNSFYSERYGYREENVDRARSYDYAQRAAFFGFSAVYIYSLVDGFRNKRISLKE